MSGHWLAYDLAKERRDRLMREAEMTRKAMSSSRIRSLPSSLRGLFVLLLPPVE